MHIDDKMLGLVFKIIASVLLASFFMHGSVNCGYTRDLLCQPLDIVFVIDRSGSVRDSNPAPCLLDTPCDNWFLMRSFIADLIRNITPGRDTRFGAVVFGSDKNTSTHVVFALTSDRRAATSHVMNLPYRPHHTATYRGLRLMRQQVFSQSGDRGDVRNVAIVITDGEPTQYEGGGTFDRNVTQATADAVEEAELAKEVGIVILALGVTSSVNNDTIIALASDGIGVSRPVR